MVFVCLEENKREWGWGMVVELNIREVRSGGLEYLLLFF